MKKTVSMILASLMFASVLTACAPPAGQLDPAITLASSDATAKAEWLADRLDVIPDDIVIGIGSNDSYGIDMTDFEDDGYIARAIGGEVLLFGKTEKGLDRAVRVYAKAAESGRVEALDEVYHEGERIKKLTIAGRDISEYTIYYPAENNENMLFAVSELQQLIEKACGVALPAHEGSPAGPAIEFRFSDDESLRDDGYRYTVYSDGIVFEGAYKRGCMNAVWRFFEKELNWTNLIYGESYLPEADHIDIVPGTEVSETPAFDYLEMYRHYWGSYENDKANPTDIQNSYGVMRCTMHGLHHFSGLDGAAAQICYTDDDIYSSIEYEVELYIKNQLAAGQKIGVDFFGVDIGQNDSVEYCRCKDCIKVFKKEQSNSGAVVLFANRLAEAMSVDYEGLYYKIFAYAGTNVPPKEADPNEWIHVTFCTDFNCSNHKADGSECAGNHISAPSSYPKNSNNADYDEWLRKWCEITDSVYVWLYALEHSLDQYTTLYNMYDDFRHFYDLGADGVFFQCQFDGLGIQRIQHQMLAQLQWNIDMTEDEWEENLCVILEKEFGDGWQSIREYIEMWERAQDLVSCWHCWGGNLLASRTMNPDYYEANFDTFVALFEDAVKNANSAAQQERAESLSCHMYYLGCYASYFRAEARGDTERMELLSDRYSHMIYLLYKNGFDPVGGIASIDGALNYYPLTIEEIAVGEWDGYKNDLIKGIN